MMKKCTNYLKHFIIYLISFSINYLIFFIFINILGDGLVTVQIINLFSWTFSMLFIFFIDKKFVPDLVNEHNSDELFKFILIRFLSLIVEVVLLFIFVSVLKFNCFTVKLITLILLFILNHFYVSRVKFD